MNTSFCCSPRTLSRLRVSSGCSVLWVVSSIFARSMVLGSCHSQILLIESAIVVKIPSSRSFEKLYPSFATFVVGKCFVIPSVPVIPPNSLSIPLRVDRTRKCLSPSRMIRRTLSQSGFSPAFSFFLISTDSRFTASQKSIISVFFSVSYTTGKEVRFPLLASWIWETKSVRLLFTGVAVRRRTWLSEFFASHSSICWYLLLFSFLRLCASSMIKRSTSLYISSSCSRMITSIFWSEMSLYPVTSQCLSARSFCHCVSSRAGAMTQMRVAFFSM